MQRGAPAFAARVVVVALFLSAPTVEASAQRLSLLDSNLVRQISEEISGDAAYAHVRHLTQFHRPRGGSDNLYVIAQYFERQAKEAGLENVRLIKQSSTSRPWNARFADLWITGAFPERIASTLETPLQLADYSRSADVTAELIDVGAGTVADLTSKDVRGKVVLTHGSLTTIMTEAVINRGALGVVWYPDPYTAADGTSGAGVSRPDQVRWNSIPSGQVNGKEPTFAFTLSLRQGVELHNKLARGPVTVRALVDAAFTSQQGDTPWQVMVEAFIPGSDPSAGQDIVLTGHMQEGQPSTNDDASGCASVLEIGRALTRLIAEGRIPRPKRNIRLWWATEISSERQYFADNPDAHRRIWANINQDMVGADQSQDIMRVQNVTRVPASRFHFLNDVMEAVLDYMVAANNYELAQAQAGIALYPRPYFSPQGSMHRYNAKAIWFHENTDHMTFNEAPIGVPAISFTNMPDRFIHSNEDDLWNIDRTQLGRNAVSVALIAYTMATAGGNTFPILAGETVGRGNERLAQNLRLALTWIAARVDKSAAYHDASNQIRYAAARERMAIRSLGQVASSVSVSLPPLLAELERRLAQAQRDVDLAYRQSGAQQVPGLAPLSDVEQSLSRIRPALVGGPKEFLTGRSQIQNVSGLHGRMATEIIASVNGSSTGLDIYRFVVAEAREAGPHYYGVVTPEAVLRYLRNVESAKLIRLDPVK